MMVRPLFIRLVITSLLCIGLGPTPARSQETLTTDQRVLRFGVHVSTMGKLDPHFAAASQDRALADMVFNGLLRYRPGNAPKIEPDLAMSIPDFEMVDGNQVWTVQLRRGVMFHPTEHTRAYEMTADDVVFSLNKSADRKYCAYAGGYAGMRFEKAGPFTVRIILNKPLSPNLFFPKISNYAGGFIVSKKVIEKLGYEYFKTHPVGTGPFVFTEYKPGKKLLLTANRGYFRGAPHLKGVQFCFVPNIDIREADLKSGKLDVIIGSGDIGWVDAIRKTPGLIIDAHGVGEVMTLYFNTGQKPLDDVRVRKAIAYAIDRKAFLATISTLFAGPVYSPVPARFLPGGLTATQAADLDLSYDAHLEKAKKLMAQAGYAEGFSLDLVASEKRLYRTAYEVLKSELAKIGIICNVKVITHSEMHRTIRHDPRPLTIYVAWRPNADVYLTRFFHSDSIVVTGAKPDTNFSAYDKIDRLIEAGRREIDPAKQISLWTQAQIRILNDMAAYPIMYNLQCYVRRADVDYGHPLVATMALYPQFTEKTHFTQAP